MFKNQGGTSLNGWSGFGAMPIARRVHGVHRGNYLEHPEEIYANATVDTFGHIIFPQDIRNCTKCHAETDTWKQEPSRVACLACHDSDEAKIHGRIMTLVLDPNDPYGPLAIETCVICHGEGTDFSPDKVHGISNPYVPPYPRAPREEELPVLTPLEAANVARGGALYDEWWAVTRAAEPSTDHPLWASRPDTTSNTRTGSITWRCKECHGWDYKGVDGAYGSGSHRTGIRGIFGTVKAAQDVFDLVKTGHGYDAAGLSDASIWDLVKFVLEGQIDTGPIIDANRKFTGSTANGETLYNSGIGSNTSCKGCHGLDGLTPPLGYPAFTEYPGLLSNQNPWEFQHKVRFGQPGRTMPSAVAARGTLQDVVDLSAYCQTLPQARLPGNVARGGAGALYDKW
jgi:thiosulfate dehydrogenase